MLGAGLALLAVKSGTSLGWILPVVAGLGLAPFFAALTARKDLGTHVAKSGLFQVAEPWWRTQNYQKTRYRQLQLDHAPLKDFSNAANDS